MVDFDLYAWTTTRMGKSETVYTNTLTPVTGTYPYKEDGTQWSTILYMITIVDSNYAYIECGNDAQGYYTYNRDSANDILVNPVVDDEVLEEETGDTVDGPQDTAPKYIEEIQDFDGNNFIIKDRNASTYHPPLLSCMWSDHLLNDIQWLRADTFSWQSGDVYATAYNTLVEEYATGTEETEGSVTFKRTANGYKIATADMESAILSKYNTEGIAWYYILDTANKQFKLPRIKHKYWKDFSVTLNKPTTLPVKGNGNLLGLQGANGTGGLAHIRNYWLGACTSTNAKIGTSITTASDSTFTPQTAIGVTTTASNSGIVADPSALSVTTTKSVEETGFYLYFYVGKYAQTAIEQTAGLNAEMFNNKLDLNLNNLSNKGKKVIDGQWTNLVVTLASEANLPTSRTTFDLSSYLPNDDYSYEIIVRGQVVTPAISGSASRLYVYSSIISSNVLIASIRTRTDSTVEAGSSVIIPVGTDKTLSVYGGSSYVGTYALLVYGYRRLGTNL